MTERRLICLYALGLLLMASLSVPALRAAGRDIDLAASSDAVRFEGFAAEEGGARRTIASEPRVLFDRPLPRELVLRVSGHATGVGEGKDVMVRIPGGQAQSIRFLPSGTSQDVKLSNPWFASAILWSIPCAPGAGDGCSNAGNGIALTGLQVLR